MNVRVSEEFGMYFARIPLTSTPHIHQANALTTEWSNVLPAQRANYVFGNPPFVGAKFMDDEQREETRRVFEEIDSGGLLDYVAAWYVTAARYIRQLDNPAAPQHGKSLTAPHTFQIRCAFVSTNSIAQGEQVGVLWGWLLNQGIHIHFAHRTFQWNNEARGMAAVHCVIIGFGAFDVEKKTIYEYEDIRGEPHAVSVANINPYLVDAPDVVLEKRSQSISNAPRMSFGNQPIDGGNLLLSEEEKSELLRVEPQALPFIRPFLGADEFINSIPRYCLWLKDANPEQLRHMPEVRKRIEAVQVFRQSSKRPATRELAQTPTLFAFVSHPETDYLLVPSVSSERRQFVPIGFMPSEVIASNLCLIVPNATRYHFGILSSTMHNAWLRYVAGRLKSDFRYSAGIVYNNFPWPDQLSDSQREKIEAAAQAVLDARAQFPNASLADLYDPLTMPPVLVKAHQTLDAAVDAAYGKKDFKNDAGRVSFLFELYLKYTTLLPGGTNSTSPDKLHSSSAKRKRTR